MRACALLVAMLVAAPALAQPRRQAGGDGGGKPKAPTAGAVEPAQPTPPAKGKPKVFDFNTLDISGRLRTPQLLYFLDRAHEELERASLERRSFIPEMVKSIDESAL